VCVRAYARKMGWSWVALLVPLVVDASFQLQMPRDAALHSETGVYNLSAYLEFDYVPRGTLALTQAEVVARCGDFLNVRWTPWRFTAGALGRVEIKPPVSFDGKRIARGLSWWMCNDTNAWTPLPNATVTSIDAVAKGSTYALLAPTCGTDPKSLSCFDCVDTSITAGCFCDGPLRDSLDVIVTCVIVGTLGLVNLASMVLQLRWRAGHGVGSKRGSYASTNDTEEVSAVDWEGSVFLNSVETLAHSLVFAHSLDDFLRWPSVSAYNKATLGAASALLFLSSIRTVFESRGCIGILVVIAMPISFALQTIMMVAEAYPGTTVVYTTVGLCMFTLLVTAGVRLSYSTGPFVLFGLLSVASPATYALSLWGQECTTRI